METLGKGEMIQEQMNVRVVERSFIGAEKWMSNIAVDVIVKITEKNMILSLMIGRCIPRKVMSSQ